MNPRARAVLRKELLEYRRNKLIVFTMAALPVIFLIMTTVSIVTLPDEVPEALLDTVLGPALLFLFIVPVVIPTTVAGYSVIGEREQGTLEPVLTTPATDADLLHGKVLAATIPSILLAWLLYVAFVLVLAGFGPSGVVGRLVNPAQLTAQGVLVPALAVYAIIVGMLISARSSDIRVAQQLSGLAVLPVIAGIMVANFSATRTSVGLFLLVAGVIGILDVLGWRLMARMFSRERLLTRFGR